MKCCFTGHRIIKLTEPLKRLVYDELTGLIKRGVTDFYAGGAIGWDTLCSETVICLREKYPHIKLHLVLSCSEAEQTARWNEQQRQTYRKIRKAADSIEILSDNYYDGCMKELNKRLAELADVCFCYYDERQNKSGTKQTVTMAERKGIPVINIWRMEQEINMQG
ncbi:MAG: SLOG family protein [Oscillospiraceae bacterium]